MKRLRRDFFPPPSYLEPPAWGLDISDRSAKFFQLTKKPNRCGVNQFGEIPLPVGLIEGGQVKQPQELTKALERLPREFGLRDVLFSLPEELAYVVRLSLPPMDAADLRSSIEVEIEEHVPLKPTELLFDYELVKPPSAGEKAAGLDVVVSALPLALVESYANSLLMAGLTPRACEIEAQSTARSLLSTDSTETVLIIDFGETRTSFFVVESNCVVFTSTLNQISGQSIELSIQRNLGVDAAEAKRLKVERGLFHSCRNDQLDFAITPTASILRDELLRLVAYWSNHNVSQGRKIVRVILCGGQSTLPGLVEYLAASTPLPILLGDVWARLCHTDETTPPIIFNQAQRYTAAIGLALRQWEND